MGTMNIPAQLRQARQAHGEDLCTLAQRIGVRHEYLRAIEDGRFGDLPPGIYGRAAIRHFAAAFGFDGAAMLAECEALLTRPEEPIAALARARGLRPATPSHVREGSAIDDRSGDAPYSGWRHLAAAAVDAAVVAALLLIVVVAALTLLTVPVSALRNSGPAFAIMGLVLGAAYFLCFGGVRGMTIGERAFAVEKTAGEAGAVTIAIALERAMLAATGDLRCIERSGERLGRYVAEWIEDAADQRAKRSA